LKDIPQLLTEYRTLLETVDDWFQRCAREFGRDIRCRPGCSQCCRGLFDITLLDARLLRQGFEQLPESTQNIVLPKARARLAELQRLWPDFNEPYVLNGMPDAMWTEMPEDDLTPCPLLDDTGCCLVYSWRPMTCRLHGLPNIDLSGESFSDDWCTLNFTDSDPLLKPELRWSFRSAFETELRLFREYAKRLCGRAYNELDTFIPLALLIDFQNFPLPS